jgi:hypothetical protein
MSNNSAGQFPLVKIFESSVSAADLEKKINSWLIVYAKEYQGANVTIDYECAATAASTDVHQLTDVIAALTNSQDANPDNPPIVSVTGTYTGQGHGIILVKITRAYDNEPLTTEQFSVSFDGGHTWSTPVNTAITPVSIGNGLFVTFQTIVKCVVNDYWFFCTGYVSYVNTALYTALVKVQWYNNQSADRMNNDELSATDLGFYFDLSTVDPPH